MPQVPRRGQAPQDGCRSEEGTSSRALGGRVDGIAKSLLTCNSEKGRDAQDSIRRDHPGSGGLVEEKSVRGISPGLSKGVIKQRTGTSGGTCRVTNDRLRRGRTRILSPPREGDDPADGWPTKSPPHEKGPRERQTATFLQCKSAAW